MFSDYVSLFTRMEIGYIAAPRSSTYHLAHQRRMCQLGQLLDLGWNPTRNALMQSSDQHTNQAPIANIEFIF